mgnify:CR=1 FL=1
MISIYSISALILAYLFGSIPTAVWLGQGFYGIDIREYGSGNAGATNTFRVLGKKFDSHFLHLRRHQFQQSGRGTLQKFVNKDRLRSFHMICNLVRAPHRRNHYRAFRAIF